MNSERIIGIAISGCEISLDTLSLSNVYLRQNRGEQHTMRWHAVRFRVEGGTAVVVTNVATYVSHKFT